MTTTRDEIKELVIIDQESIPQIFTTNGADELLESIKQKVNEFVPDVSTKAGRDEIRSNAYKISQSKTLIDGHGKDLASDMKAKIKVIDKSRKTIKDALDELRDKTRLPLTEWEAAEEKRLEKLKLEKEISMCFDLAIEKNRLFDIEKELKLKQAELDKQIEEKRIADELEEEKKQQKIRDDKIRDDAIKAEREKADQAIEDERQKSAQREADAISEKNRIQREKDEIEEQRIADIEKAEEDKAAAVKEAKRQTQAEADKKERDRLAAEILADRIAKEKAENVEHRKSLNNQSLNDLLDHTDLSEIECKNLIALILNKKIRNITINY